MGRKNQNIKDAFCAIVVTAVLIILSVSTVSPAKVQAASKPTLTKTTCNVYEGNSYDLNIKNRIKGSTYKWTTSNKKIATVNSNGVVKGISQGKATITCTVKAPKKTYKLTCKVTVKPYKIGTKLSIGNTEITVTKVFTTTEVIAEGGGFIPDSDEVFYGIELDVLTKNRPASGHYWYSNDFIESIVSVDGAKYAEPWSTGNNKIYPNKKDTVIVYISIEKNDTINSIVLSDGKGNTVTVTAPISIAMPTATPEVTPTTVISPTPAPDVSYKIGDKISIGNTEITVTEVFTTTEVKIASNGSSYTSNSGEEFYGIMFDVLTKNQPDSGRYWNGISFIESIVTYDGVMYNRRNIFGEANKIYPNENNSETVYIPVEKGDIIASIVISDGEGNIATVSVR